MILIIKSLCDLHLIRLYLQLDFIKVNRFKVLNNFYLLLALIYSKRFKHFMDFVRITSFKHVLDFLRITSFI